MYQGSVPPRGRVLRDLGFDVLVLCADEHQFAEAYDGIEVVLAPTYDDEDPRVLQRFLPVWERAAAVVSDRIERGQKVLVTCRAGLNRSGMVSAMALHRLTGWSGERCVEHVQTCREHALCNQTFAQHLIDTLEEETR